MKLSVYAASTHLKATDVRHKTAVVVDMLRATSTIVTALDNGASAVSPIPTIEDAMAIKHSNTDILLGGERNAEKILDFDLGNSPLEYTRKKVLKKNIVLCTSNGSRAIKAAANADRVIIAALINVSAVAKKLAEIGDDIVIVCAGTNSKFSIDDIYTAGAIIYHLNVLGVRPELDDLGVMCVQIYTQNRQDIRSILKQAAHYTHLSELGYIEDLDYCLKEDLINFAPEYADGSITRG